MCTSYCSVIISEYICLTSVIYIRSPIYIFNVESPCPSPSPCRSLCRSHCRSHCRSLSPSPTVVRRTLDIDIGRQITRTSDIGTRTSDIGTRMSDIGTRMSDIISILDVVYAIIAPVSFCLKQRPIEKDPEKENDNKLMEVKKKKKKKNNCPIQ